MSSNDSTDLALRQKNLTSIPNAKQIFLSSLDLPTTLIGNRYNLTITKQFLNPRQWVRKLDANHYGFSFTLQQYHETWEYAVTTEKEHVLRMVVNEDLEVEIAKVVERIKSDEGVRTFHEWLHDEFDRSARQIEGAMMHSRDVELEKANKRRDDLYHEKRLFNNWSTSHDVTPVKIKKLHSS